MKTYRELNEQLYIIFNTTKSMSNELRLWKNRFKVNKLSLEKQIFIVEKFSDQNVLITLKAKRNAERYIFGKEQDAE